MRTIFYILHLNKLAILAILVITGCKTFVMDPSPAAADSGALTLIFSACSTVPTRGFDACLVKAGQSIQSALKFQLPVGDNFISGELTMLYKDIVKTYAITEKTLHVPWKDLIQQDTWTSDLDGTAIALALIRYNDPDGVERIMIARGEARLLVLSEGYAPAAIDSGFTAWKGKTKCVMGYTTAGRSWIQYK